MKNLLNKAWFGFVYIVFLVLLMNLCGADSFTEALGWTAVGAAFYFVLASLVWHFSKEQINRRSSGKRLALDRDQ